jgi:hypothetical protein
MRNDDDWSLLAKIVSGLIALVCGGAAVVGYVAYERPKPPRPLIVPGSVAPTETTHTPTPAETTAAPSPTSHGSVSVPGR